MCGLVDFELLERTPVREDIIKREKRADYFKRQEDRFDIEIPKKFHPYLHHVSIMDIDYVYGNVESTKGRLWVVGRDPYLFDYFLPERWEGTPKTKLSIYNEIYTTVTKENIRLTVESQGTVSPKTVSDLVPEVAGKVTYVSPSLAAGGFFEKNELLLKIDPQDYKLALIRSEAEVAQARLRLEQERAEAAVALKEWQELGKGEEATPLVLREPQLAQAEAALEAAGATLKQAKRDLERTEIQNT